MSRVIQKKATAAQARLIATLFADEKEISVSTGYNAPTLAALVKNGWITDTGRLGHFPSGLEFNFYRLSDAGLLALELHLFDRRTPKRSAA